LLHIERSSEILNLAMKLDWLDERRKEFRESSTGAENGFLYVERISEILTLATK
jgi:hypothetical protein